MIEVTRLDGKKYWINPHLIECMETNPDLMVEMMSGRKVILKDNPQDVIDKIIEYRKKLGINSQEA